MTACKVGQDWAELNREALLEKAYNLLSDQDLDIALHTGIVLPKNKVRIICIVDIDVAKWLAQREDQENDINLALRKFMEWRSKQSVPIEPLSLDKIPKRNSIICATIHNFFLLDENDWFFDEDENQAHNIVTLDLTVVDWYQTNYGQRYEAQIRKVLRSLMESQQRSHSNFQLD